MHRELADIGVPPAVRREGRTGGAGDGAVRGESGGGGEREDDEVAETAAARMRFMIRKYPIAAWSKEIESEG